MSDLEQGQVVEFPENRHGLKDLSCLIAKQDLSALGIKNGGSIPIKWDGEYVRCGPLTWSVEKICDEIDQGVWEVMNDKDAESLIEAYRERANATLN